MSRRRKLPSIGDLMEQYLAGKDWPVLSDNQRFVWMAWVDIIDRQDSDDQREFLIDQLRRVSLPQSGRPLQDQAVEAEARRFWRTGYQELRAAGVLADEAAERMAHIIRQRWPRLFRANKEIKTKTITDRFQRRAILIYRE